TRASDPAARERLDSMRRNGWIYLRVLRTQHNHMRALRVMEENRTLSHDSPSLKAGLLPILADEDANTAATIALLREFPPNPSLGGSWDKKDPQRRDVEIEKLQAKRQRMR